MPRSVSPNGERTNRHIANATTAALASTVRVKRAVGQQRCRTDVATHAVLATGHLGPAQADTPDDHAERQRQQQKVDAGGTHCEKPEDRRNQCGGEHASAESDRRRQSGMARGIDDDIGGDAEDRAMAK